MKQLACIALLCGVVVLFVTTLSPLQATAQVLDSEWSGPYRLSSGAGEASRASILSDPYGYVHVFWAESGFADDRTVIQYARFDGSAWSAPIDIFLSEPAQDIANLATAISPEGMLHLLWSGGGSGSIYHLTAPAHDALSAKRWQTLPLIRVEALNLQIQIDSRNQFHITYTNFYGQAKGIYYLRSTDQGSTWSEPLRLDPDIPANHAPLSLDMSLDDNDGLHAVWHYIDLEVPGSVGTEVLYSHSLDGGEQWSRPFTIDINDEVSDEVRIPNPILATAGEQVIVIWAGTSQTERDHRVSWDSGQSWEPTERAFGALHGQAGDAVVVDSRERLHFFGQLRYPQGLYHMEWNGNSWAVPSLFYLIALTSDDPRGARIHAHFLEATSRVGNQLVLTFTTSPGDPQSVLYAMWYTLSDVAQVGTQPTPAATTTLPLQPTATLDVPTATPRVALSDLQDTPITGGVVRQDEGIWISLVPTLLLVGALVGWWFIERR